MNDRLVRVATAAFLAGALGFAALPAAAQGGYAGASLGQFDDKNLDTTTGFKVFGGYQFNKNFAAEVSFISASWDVSGTTLDGTGVTLAGVAMAPVSDQVTVFATAGLLSWNAEFGPISDSGSNIFFGFGGLFNISRDLAIRAEYGSYKLGGDIVDTTITALTVGAQFRF